MGAAITAVLFDVDGTLVDSLPAIYEGYLAAFQTRAPSIPSVEEIRGALGLPVREILRSRLDPDALDSALMDFFARYRVVQSTHARVYPGTQAVLDALRAMGCRLGIVTDKTRITTDVTLEHFGLAKYFASVRTSDDVRCPKPDPDGLMLALTDLNVSPANALFVGDSPRDIEAGRAAGVRTAGALWGYGSREILGAAAPDVLLENIGEIPRFVDRWESALAETDRER